MDYTDGELKLSIILTCRSVIRSFFVRLIIIVIFFGFIFSYAGDLKLLEKSYLTINENIKIQQNKIDSLTTLLNKRVSFIEEEKKKKSKVNDLMAEALLLSEEISTEQNILKNLDKNLKSHANKLGSLYTLKIDSLQLKMGLTKNTKEKEGIKKAIYLLTGKRFLLTPVFYALSFKPEKIVNIDLSSAKDSFEIIVFKEYLQNADSELEKHLTKIKKTKQDLERISGLKKKTNEFLEDIQDEGSWAIISEDTKPNDVYGGIDFPIETERGTKQFSLSTQFLNNYVNYQNLWLQLNEMKSDEYSSSITGTKDSVLTEVNMDDYLDLLEKLEKKLEQYLIEIQNKLN